MVPSYRAKGTPVKTTSKRPTIWWERYSVSGFSKRCGRKCYETVVIHFSLTRPRISWFRYYFNLLAAPPEQCVSLLMIPLWACLTLEHGVHTNEPVHRICSAWEKRSPSGGERRRRKHGRWGCITPFVIRLCASLNGSQLTSDDSETW